MAEIAFLDGGLGQEIQNRAKADPHPLWSLKVMYDEPELVSEVHRDFITAGARVITANTYTASPPRLRRDGDFSQIQDIHNTALRLVRDVVDEAGDDKLQIAGCLPPLVGSYVAEVSMNYEARLLIIVNWSVFRRGCRCISDRNHVQHHRSKAALAAVKETAVPGYVGLTVTMMAQTHCDRVRQ